MKVFKKKKDITTVTSLYVLITFLKSSGRYEDFLKKKEECLNHCILPNGTRFPTSISGLFKIMYGKKDNYESFYFFLRDNFYNFNHIETHYIRTMTTE